MIEVFLPIGILVITFFMKLLIDRSTTAPLWIASLYELPVDMLFLGLSFFVASIIAKNDIDPGLTYVFTVFGIGFPITYFWRRSISLYDNRKLIESALLATLNASISGYIVYRSIIELLR